MEIRNATFEDLRAIVDFAEKYHQTSDMKGIDFVRMDFLKVIEHYMQARDCFSQVAVGKDDEIVGMLFGTLNPFMFNRKAKWASDLFFISNGAGPALLRRFKEWAEYCGADRVVMGVSSGDPRADRVIELSGFTQTGGMWVCHL